MRAAAEADLTQLSPWEKQQFAAVFGDSVDFSQVRISQSAAVAWVAGGTTLGNNITWSPRMWKEYLLARVEKTSLSPLIHEMVHVWQYQNFGGGYLAGSMFARLGDGYDFPRAIAKGTPFNDMNVEQQAEFIKSLVNAGFIDRAADARFYVNPSKACRMGECDTIVSSGSPPAGFIDATTAANEALAAIRRARPTQGRAIDGSAG